MSSFTVTPFASASLASPTLDAIPLLILTSSGASMSIGGDFGSKYSASTQSGGTMRTLWLTAPTIPLSIGSLEAFLMMMASDVYPFCLLGMDSCWSEDGSSFHSCVRCVPTCRSRLLVQLKAPSLVSLRRLIM